MGKRWSNGLIAKPNRNVRVRHVWLYVLGGEGLFPFLGGLAPTCQAKKIKN